MNQYVNENCPICGGYVVLTTNGTKICEKCHYLLPGSNWAYSSTVTSADKYCANCNTKMEELGEWWYCPKCGYGHMDYIGDLPKELSGEEVEMSKKIFEGKLHIPCDNIWGVGIGKMEPTPYTLQIDTDLIKLKHKEMELEFELEPDKLANIDTIVINGYKYVKEKEL